MRGTAFYLRPLLLSVLCVEYKRFREIDVATGALARRSGAQHRVSLRVLCLSAFSARNRKLHSGKFPSRNLTTFPPIAFAISSSVNPCFISASVINAIPLASNGSVTAPSKSDPSAT